MTVNEIKQYIKSEMEAHQRLAEDYRKNGLSQNELNLIAKAKVSALKDLLEILES